MSRRHQPKIGVGRQPAPEWVLEHGDRAWHARGPSPELQQEWIEGGLAIPDVGVIRQYRIDRIRAELTKNECAGILLYDPLNIRYATDTTNMSLWTMHNQVRYVFVATDGPCIIFEYSQGEFLATYSGVVDEVRPATSFIYFYVGDRIQEVADRWAGEIADVVAEHGRGSKRLAVDNIDLDGVRALERQGLQLFSGMPLMEDARAIKHEEEIKAMRCSVHATEQAIARMHRQLQPGVREIDLWATLWHETIRRNGEWIETRLLSSGPRTNPWYHEASGRAVEEGDFVAFDTDLIGPYGACVDMSRTWLCGDGRPDAQQANTFAMARDQVARNLELFQPGATFGEITAKAWYPAVNEFNHYTCLAHGVGLCDEYPTLYVREAWDATGYEGTVRVGMVFSVESFVGPRAGGQGVKLEDQFVITETGPELLTNYPLGWGPPM
ncbi:MAG: aminopeptidase P family protein [Actinomycetia bacterium]|nr:aminopeptidase P family protein [Actinomycetes bacterium]